MKIIQSIAMVALALSLSQMAYANHHGADGMVCNHRQGMQDADTNKDGVISRDEFTTAHQKMADEMFTIMDTNNDGNIDQAEKKACKEKMGKNCKMKDHKMSDMKDHKMPDMKEQAK